MNNEFLHKLGVGYGERYESSELVDELTDDEEEFTGKEPTNNNNNPINLSELYKSVSLLEMDGLDEESCKQLIRNKIEESIGEQTEEQSVESSDDEYDYRVNEDDDDDMFPIVVSHNTLNLDDNIRQEYNCESSIGSPVVGSVSMRSDPKFVNLVRKHINSNANTELMIKNISKKYKDYITISEDEGIEDIKIDINNYKVDKTKEILLNNELSSDEKIELISKLIYL